MSDPGALASVVLERTVALARIPAPTGDEAARGTLVARWWREDGWQVTTDPVGNVWACVRSGAGPAVVLAAHLDTVFAAEVAHDIVVRGERLLGPSVGDDAVAVAALSAVGTMLAGADGWPVWLLATVGEEGLGNLRGMIAALEGSKVVVGAVLAVEGNYLGRVSTTGVGSIRWRVEIEGPGGHAWEAADAASAVHAAAGVMVEIAALDVAGARTAVNVGRIGGGEAINARARRAWFEVDLRADHPEALRILEARARAAVDTGVPDGLSVSIEELGRRPAGGLDAQHPLARTAASALEAAGIEPTFEATSTDANAAHARGIPAIAVGVTRGGGEHTPQEWIEIAPIADGLSVLAATVTRFQEATP